MKTQEKIKELQQLEHFTLEFAAGNNIDKFRKRIASLETKANAKEKQFLDFASDFFDQIETMDFLKEYNQIITKSHENQ